MSKNNRPSIQELSKSFSIGSADQVIKGEIKIKLEQEIKKNISLIDKIPEKHHIDIANTILASWGDLSVLVPYFEKFEGISKNEAREIATSQTIMAHSDLDAIRMKSLGVKKYEWLHTKGAHCPEHLELDGQVFSFDEPPVIDTKIGLRGKPGDIPSCRCKMLAKISFDDLGTTENKPDRKVGNGGILSRILSKIVN